MAVLLLAPKVSGFPMTVTPGALLFVETPADDTSAPAMSVVAVTALEADSVAQEPQPDQSFHCIARPSLRFEADRPGWQGEQSHGVVTGATRVSRGSITGTS